MVRKHERKKKAQTERTYWRRQECGGRQGLKIKRRHNDVTTVTI
jgi:hypothetical protein